MHRIAEERAFDDLVRIAGSELLFIICGYLNQHENHRIYRLLRSEMLANRSVRRFLESTAEKIKKINSEISVPLDDVTPRLYQMPVFKCQDTAIFRHGIEPTDGFSEFQGTGLALSVDNSDILNATFADKLRQIEMVDFVGLNEIKMFGMLQMNNLYIKSRIVDINANWRRFDVKGFRSMFAKVQHITLSGDHKTYFVTQKRGRGDEVIERVYRIFPDSVTDMRIEMYYFDQIYYQNPILPASLRNLTIDLKQYLPIMSDENIRRFPGSIKVLRVETKLDELNLENYLSEGIEELAISVKSCRIILGHLPESVKIMTVKHTGGVELIIKSSRLTTLVYIPKSTSRLPFFKCDTDRHPDLRQLNIMNDRRITYEFGPQSVPDGITELYIHIPPFILTPLASLQIFRKPSVKNAVIFGTQPFGYLSIPPFVSFKPKI